MGLMGGLFNRAKDNVREKARTVKVDLVIPDREKLESESVVIQKVCHLIHDSLRDDYFNSTSIVIIGGILYRNNYALADSDIFELHKVIGPMFERINPDGELSDQEIGIAKTACINFAAAIAGRGKSDPYIGKSFILSGTFLKGTQNKVTEHLEKHGLSLSHSDYYADYIIIGCKPTKRHPSEDFSDIVVAAQSERGNYDGYKRTVIAEYNFELLEESILANGD